MQIVLCAPFDMNRYIQAPVPPGKTLGMLVAPHQAGITGCHINGVFRSDWQSYQPHEEDAITLFLATQDPVTGAVAAYGVLWGTVINAALVVAVSTVISLGLQYGLRALQSDPTASNTAGKTEQVYGLAGSTGALLGRPGSGSLVVDGEVLAVPPGMAELLAEVRGLPFRLGARHPSEGAIDCLGLVGYLLREGLGIDVEGRATPGGDLLLSHAFVPVWSSPPDVADDGWVCRLQPYDVLVWQCDEAQGPLLALGAGDVTTWLHVAMAITPGWLVSATMDQGVILHSAQRTAALYGAAVQYLVRPTAAAG